MKIFVRIIFFIFALLLISCSGNKDKVSIIKEKDMLKFIGLLAVATGIFWLGDVLGFAGIEGFFERVTN